MGLWVSVVEQCPVGLYRATNAGLGEGFEMGSKLGLGIELMGYCEEPGVILCLRPNA